MGLTKQRSLCNLSAIRTMNLSSSASIFFFLLSLLLQSNAQQPYINNIQLDCYEYNNLNATNGFVCNGPQKSCNSYLTFQSHPPYDSASTIGSFLNAEPSAIARINNISNVLEKIPTNTQLIIPVNCSCAVGLFYQHNASYTLTTEYETYFTVSNDTYQGLTTCQAMMKQNPYDSRQPNTRLILLSPKTNTLKPKSPSKDKKWVFVVIGVGVGLLLIALFGLLLCFMLRRNRNSSRSHLLPTADIKANNSGVVSSKGVRQLVDSLTVYTFEELQKATGCFKEDHRIKGSVYQGVIRGDHAAINRKPINEIGNISSPIAREINIPKQINHSSIIRLSGLCIQEEEGNTYLVYEFAENGSLSYWLHDKNKQDSRLGWNQRLQIAYDIADGLNYLHNYTKPPYIHKDLKSSNILLNADFRAKMTNFGLARTVDSIADEEEDGGGGLHLTKHVVGTRGYMPPEYIENGVVTPELDVFAFGLVMLELLSGREAVTASGDSKEVLLSESITLVLEGENVREKLKAFMDPSLESHYPFLQSQYALDSALSMANLAMNCVACNINSRPTMSEVFILLRFWLSETGSNRGGGLLVFE